MALARQRRKLLYLLGILLLLTPLVAVYNLTKTNNSTTIAITDYLDTIQYSRDMSSISRTVGSVKPKDINGKVCSSAKKEIVRQQVGIFTDLCEVMTGRNDGCFYKHPEVAHFVKFTASQDTELTFQEFISILSVHRFYKPEKIVIHTNAQCIIGKYWTLAKKLSTRIELRYTGRITDVGNDKLRPDWITHEADILKVQTMLQEGGIFMDFDSVILNGTKLRATQRLAECVIGSDIDPCTRLCAGFMSCVPSSTFVEAWWKGYQENYVPNSWIYNAGTVPSNILRSCTNCYDVYVDRTISNILLQKRWMEKNGISWKNKTAVHYINRIYELHSKDITPEALFADLADTSLGEMFKYILGDYLSFTVQK